MSNIPLIQWYPGHIAKAERALTKNIHLVDLVIEVRDARIPSSSSHPLFKKWIDGKNHMLVINRQDMITTESKSVWQKWFENKKQENYWCDSKSGKGINEIKLAAIRSGTMLNNRRVSRGMKKRAVRTLVLGFPNVGKSALINRLIGRNTVPSARRAGVTKSLRWIRMGSGLDLLDAPGVLPTKLTNQEAAINLAFCDDIGEASYDVELIAAEFIKKLNKLSTLKSSGFKQSFYEKRYGIPMNGNMDAIQWIQDASSIHTSGDTSRMSSKLLDDYRKLLLGKVNLELPND